MPNKTNSQRHRFNVFDFILIFVFLAIIVGVLVLVIRAIPTGNTITGNNRVTYVISVSDVHETVVDQLSKNQKMYGTDTGAEIGVISDIKRSEHIVKGVDQSTGEQILNPVPGRFDLEITVTVDANFDGSLYKINGTVIACGEIIGFRTSTAALSGECISMSAQKQ